jgi:hypothetical protein
MGAGVFAAWRAWVQHGTLPGAGGWAAQSLRLLNCFSALGLIDQTWRYYRQREADLSKLTALQLDLIRWLEDEDG